MSMVKNQNRPPNAMNTQYIKQPWEYKSADDFFDEPRRMMHVYRAHAGKYAAVYFVVSIPLLVSAILVLFKDGGISDDAETAAILLGFGCLLLFLALRYYQMAKRNIAEMKLQAQKQKSRKKKNRK